MITHGRVHELLETLARLVSLPESPPVVVVDNGSSDGTAAAVRGRFPGVTLVSLAENHGATGRNIGVRHLTTPYVAFADDDSWWAPGSLERAIGLMDAHPRLAVVNGRIIVEPVGEVDAISEEMAASPLPADEDVPGAPLLSFLAGASVIRRRAFLAAGGFAPRLFLDGEEELLGADLVSRGWRMRYVADVTVHHRASTSRDAHQRRRRGIRNTLWFTWLRRPAPAAMRRTLTLARQVPKDRVSLAAFADAVRGLPWIVRERERVPPHVERGLRALQEQQNASEARRYVS
ncbi:MAG: glycosyltransferase [Actinomycetota bacterium]|nr:glycosyltransferase [Actinomycetota bacterium]